MIFDFLKEMFFGKIEKSKCPVCGGIMVGRKTISDPYHVWFECESCGAVSDGVRYWKDRSEIR